MSRFSLPFRLHLHRPALLWWLYRRYTLDYRGCVGDSSNLHFLSMNSYLSCAESCYNVSAARAMFWEEALAVSIPSTLSTHP